MNLTIALERYDRHFPFFDGTVKAPEGIDLKALQVGQGVSLRDGRDRHERMLSGEFDVAEFSMSTFLMAIDRNLPIIGVPVFPRRLFSAGLFYVRADSDISKPTDLEGKRVAIRSFQTTLSLLAKGDLKFEYGVPWEKIHWLTQEDEKISFDVKPGVEIEKLPKGTDLGLLLESGRADAIIEPHPPLSILSGKVSARRLFVDATSEELRYFKKYGYFPIMHIVAVREEIVEREPSLPTFLIAMFRHAREIANGYFSDPAWSSLAFGQRYYEAEKTMFGTNIRPDGLAANRSNLERFVMYSRDQGLIRRDLSVDDLLASSVRHT